MFPFFSTNFPCRFARQTGVLPRVVVDGFFSVDRNRFGCPDFKTMEHQRKEMEEDNRVDESSKCSIDRTVSLSVFPHEVLNIQAFDSNDQISPQIHDPDNMSDQMSTLFRLATQCGTKKDYYTLYEQGWEDVERWISQEEKRCNMN
jgi:hypothetical protein